MTLQDQLDDLVSRRRERRWLMRIQLIVFVIGMPGLIVFGLSSEAAMVRVEHIWPFAFAWGAAVGVHLWSYLESSAKENMAAVAANAATGAATIAAKGVTDAAETTARGQTDAAITTAEGRS